ncbi:hypothetical protein EDD86DRAFT_206423 [Gorgonomyces haynaldii]|nr:hypothetical protein EDD86DRAFT_206423 [Gorgonomyces haynaldii]
MFKPSKFRNAVFKLGDPIQIQQPGDLVISCGDWIYYRHSQTIHCKQDLTSQQEWSISHNVQLMDTSNDRLVTADQASVSLWTETQPQVLFSAPGIESIACNPAVDVISLSLADTIQTFDLQTGQPVFTLAHPEKVENMSWKHDGQYQVTVSKDNRLRVFDIRSQDALQSTVCHTGIKPSRCQWLGASDTILTTGFSKTRDREVALWDLRQFDKPIKLQRLDTNVGVLEPLYDVDTNLVYICGRGDTSVKWLDAQTLEMSQMPFVHKSTFNAFTLVPKHKMDVIKCEISRLLLIPNNSNQILQLSNFVPRRQYLDFQSDLFPDTYCGFGMTVEEYRSGKNTLPLKKSLDPTVSSSATQSVNPSSVSANLPVAVNPPTADTHHHVESREETKEEKEQERKVSEKLAKLNLPKHSPYRHVLGQSHIKYDSMQGQSSNVNVDSHGFDCNAKYFAFFLQGSGGRVGIWPVDKTGRFPPRINCIMSPSDVNDFKLSPFDLNQLALVCEDGKLHIYEITSLDQDINEPKISINAHNGRITLVQYHPSVRDLVATTSAELGEPTVKLWNLKSKSVLTTIALKEKIVSMQLIGNRVILLDKSNVSIYSTDGKLIKSVLAHEGRGVRVLVCGQYIVTVGFSKGSQRELLLFSPTLEQLSQLSLDNAPSVLIPYYDPDTNLLVLSGKGESQMHFYELDQQFVHLNRHQFPQYPTQAVSFLPKKYCDVNKIEILRGFRLCPNHVETLSVVVPRLKTEFFQDDIYNPTLDTEKPSLEIDQFLKGEKPHFHFVDLDNGKPKLSEQVVVVKKQERPKIEKQVSESDQKQAVF